MPFWPKSLPDYQWPASEKTFSQRLVNAAISGVFHLSHAVGKMAGALLGSRRRVLVVRTDGIGDALLFEPLLESLAQCVSPRRIHLWAPAATCELLRYCPGVRKLMSIPRGGKGGNLLVRRSVYWRAKMGYKMGRWSFDRVYHLSQSPEPLGNWLFANVRAKERWAASGDTENQFDWQQSRTLELSTRVIESRPGNAHELLRNDYLASQWTGQHRLRRPKLHVSESIAKQTATTVETWREQARAFGGSELIGVVPGSAMSIKSYSYSRWANALSMLWAEHRSVAVLLGGPGDASAIAALAAHLAQKKVPFIRMDRPRKMFEIGALAGKLDALLSVDTGLAHIAVAQQVSTVVVMTGGHPGRFFPWPNTAHNVALTADLPCAGCNQRCTQSEAFCLTSVDPRQIVQAYSRLKHPTEESDTVLPIRAAS